MSVVYEQSRSNNREDSRSENSDDRESIENNGWNGGIEENQLFKLIKSINSKVSLQTIFNKYSINFEFVGSANGWTQRCSCPFADHDDRSPSFGYNPEQNRFNCFGCHRAGSTVEFYAFMEEISFYEAANYFLKNKDQNEIIIKDLNNFDSKLIQLLLFDFSDQIRIFKKQHKSELASQYAEDICLGLDLYIQKTIPNRTLDVDELKIRINKLKERLNLFEQI